MRAELRRAGQLLEWLRGGLTQSGRSNLMVDTWFGILAWFGGEFDFGHKATGKAAAGYARPTVSTRGSRRRYRSAPTSPRSVHTTNWSWPSLMRGELAAAETALANAERLTHGFGFPEGQFSLAFVRFVEIWLRLETGELDRAAAAAAEVTEMGDRHGLKIIRLFGVTWQASRRRCRRHGR